MDYFLSVDGGGTKLQSVLYDSDFRLIGQGLSGSINSNFEPLENVRRNMTACIDECLKGHDIPSIREVCVAMPGPAEMYLDILRHSVDVKSAVVWGEGFMGLYAGLQKTKGIVALAGTGSGVISMDGDAWTHIGGWGSLLGDEGSGFYVGRRALLAAIRETDRMGEHTLITDILMEEYKLKELRGIAEKVYSCQNYRGVIAPIAKLVARAARQGDRIAIGIFEEAGKTLAEHTVILRKRDQIEDDRDIVVVGSVWKGHEVMFNTYRVTIASHIPGTRVCKPLFEPVMGGVIRQAIKTNGIGPKLIEHLKKEFACFLYECQYREMEP